MRDAEALETPTPRSSSVFWPLVVSVGLLVVFAVFFSRLWRLDAGAALDWFARTEPWTLARVCDLWWIWLLPAVGGLMGYADMRSSGWTRVLAVSMGVVAMLLAIYVSLMCVGFPMQH